MKRFMLLIEINHTTTEWKKTLIIGKSWNTGKKSIQMSRPKLMATNNQKVLAFSLKIVVFNLTQFIINLEFWNNTIYHFFDFIYKMSRQKCYYLTNRTTSCLSFDALVQHHPYRYPYQSISILMKMMFYIIIMRSPRSKQWPTKF